MHIQYTDDLCARATQGRHDRGIFSRNRMAPRLSPCRVGQALYRNIAFNPEPKASQWPGPNR